ncbi:MAG: hsp70 family protein, partial [Planctomycetaceae bacterium]|nr:hsp70 family protein [Planctomycetaceae bacterium]
MSVSTKGPIKHKRGQEHATDELTAVRYVVGIDLGTTNSAVSYVDVSEPDWKIRTFSVPQLAAAGLVESRETLPSFHYEPHANELTPKQIRLPFGVKKPGYVVGVYARDYGGKTTGRLVASAKSWLCHSGVDRTSKLLPWQAADNVTKLSPVDVTARYLSHIRAAWDHAFPQHPLATQDVVMTLPASFDEVARELTVRAARAAGIPKIVLLEEPQAAFYAWVNEHADHWQTLVSPGQKILVCDIGGGTTDLTLIRVRAEADGTVRFHRVAVGDHLILGGDNLDLALAHHLESRLVGQGKLAANAWGLLVRMACDVKEKLLAGDAPEKMTVSVPGVGSKLVGGSKQIEVTRDEIEQLLVDGFMPFVSLDAKPSRHQSGVREFGLPYASDHAITRYLAQFLTTHRHTGSVTDDERAHDSPIPDIVLLNGGMFEAAKMRKRLLEQLGAWEMQNAECRVQSAEWEDCNSSLLTPNSQLPTPNTKPDSGLPVCLENRRLDLAVARGAAYYGMVRRGFGERISAGLARTYYLSVQDDMEREVENSKSSASHSAFNSTLLCLLPAGTETDHEVILADRSFDLLVGEPIQFPVFVSSVRLTDRPGELLPFDPQEITALPPIQTIIRTRSKKKTAVTVQLEGKLTEIGTLELWCVERNGKGRWRLDFDVRCVTETDRDTVTSQVERDGIVDEETWLPVREALAATFGEGTEHPNRLMRRLDEASNLRRDDWPTSLLRRTGDELIERFFDGRLKSPEYEARWINLIGYAYRPGYGLSLDDWRIEQLWRKVQGNLISKTIGCRLQNWVLWRRVAGGLSAGQQQTLADPLLGNVRNLHRQATGGVGRGADMDLYSQEGAETWRLLGSLERLPLETKIELGDMILGLFRRKKATLVYVAMIWALGRLGARTLMYGQLNTIIPPQTAEQWLRKIIDRPADSDHVPAHASTIAVEQLALMQIARKTGDRYRDIGQPTRELVIATLEKHVPPLPKQHHLTTLVREVAQLDADEQGAVFGETLPL